MASAKSVLRTCGLLFWFIISITCESTVTEPRIVSVTVRSKSCVDSICKYLLIVRGGEFLGHLSLNLTPVGGPRGSNCEVTLPNYELHEIETSQWSSKIEVSIPETEGRIFFCLHRTEKRNAPFGGSWIHQGEDQFLSPGDASETKNTAPVSSNTVPTDSSRLQDTDKNWADLSHDTDVNYNSVPTRDKRTEVQILVNDNKDPYGFKVKNRDNTKGSVKNAAIDAENDPNGEQNDRNVRKARATNTTDVLLTSEDIIKARIELENDVRSTKKEELSDDALIQVRNKRAAGISEANALEVTPKVERQLAFPGLNSYEAVKAMGVIQIDGLRIEESAKEPVIVHGIPSVLADTKVTLRLYGEGLTSRTVIALTYAPLGYGQPCKFLVQGYEYMVKEGSLRAKTALFEITTPPPANDTKLYICAKNLKLDSNDPFNDEEKYIHQGTEEWKIFATHTKLMPLWVAMVLILTCLMFSALFSGLNLGLMSLDRTELKIIANTGTDQERKYARAIMPVRDHGNYLLCSILLGNVAVNSTFTILLDELTSGLFAVIFSTLAIVLLGEITPQAICSRHGLMVGAKSIMVTKAVMAITAPLAFPVSKVLDYLLGEEIGNVYNRERLKELVKVTTGVNDLDKDEVNIISGALELRKKSVKDVMTKLEDVFMLPITSVLDFETMSEIIKSGYSRIPVYEGQRGNIVTVLFIKDLAFVDPDDNTPLRTLCQYYQNPCNFVFEDVTLDVMFKQFKEGHKGHMAFVHRINSEGEGDPFYETIGLVTLEDVIEEMIQAEIVDETDVFMDNRTKRRRNRPQNNKLQDFAAFAERHENQRIHISPQLTLATFQFLSTSVDVFRPETVSETVLRRLLRQDVIQYIKLKGKTKKDAATYVYQQGKPVDYFVLILEGRVEVTVGRENLVFEAGPFTYFGVQALAQNIGVAESPTPSAMGSLQNINMDSMLRHTFVPDYSVRAVTDLYYLTVKRTLYLAAKRATLMEKGALSKGATNEQFDTEVDKLPPRLNLIQLMHKSPLPNNQSLEKISSNSNEEVSFSNTKTFDTANPCHMSSSEIKSQETNMADSKSNMAVNKSNMADAKSKMVGVSVKVCRSNVEKVTEFDVINENNSWCENYFRSEYEMRNDEHKKKKTTFHSSSSLLTVHNLSKEDDDSNADDARKFQNEITDKLDFIETRRVLFEAETLVQLSRIINLLDQKDQT